MTDYLDRRLEPGDPRIATAIDGLSFWSSRFGALLFEHLALERGIRALDVGSGTGFPLVELAEVHGASCRFVGADRWKEGMERARLKLETFTLPNVALVLADAARLPLKGACFDLVVSNLGVNNFADPRAVLAECARVARPGARIVLTTNVKGHMREYYDVFREVVAALGKPECLARLVANEDHRGAKDVLCRLLKEAGFEPRRAVEETFTLRYIDARALFGHHLTRIGFLDGWRSAVDPADERAVFAEVEARLDAIARQEGELRMTVPMLYLEGRRR